MTRPSPGSVAVTFKRDSSPMGFLGGGCTVRMFSDGRAFAELSSSEIVTAYLTPGEHVVGVAATGLCSLSAGDAELHIVVGAPRVYRVSFDPNGGVKLQATAF